MADKPVLIVTRKLPEAVLARATRDYDARLNHEDRPYPMDQLLAMAETADALLIVGGDRFDAATIARVPARVRAIATFSVGYEHIDIPAAKARGLIVTNTPDVLTEATADVALLLLLGAARRAGEGHMMVMKGEWTGWTPTQMLGTEVTAKRLGIIGMGRIGQAVADRARGFRMQIHYHNRRRIDADEEKGAVFHERLEEMLPQVDFLSINCPASPETRKLINAARLALLPKGAIVVNTARGAIVDDQALIAALRSGHLAAAGLDVFENEPNLHPGYLELSNVFLLPHLGSATTETRNAMGFRALDNLDAVFAGREPPDRLS